MLKLKKLQKIFFERNVLTVAEELLGKIFIYEDKNLDVNLSAKIVEVEAYNGKIDEASHSFKGITKRNEIMFNSGGFLYVYFTYGIHYCANIVTGKKGEGSAVLLRAMEPISGVEIFNKRRFNSEFVDKLKNNNLLNGPGKICQAFNINKNHNGLDITKNPIYILDKPKLSKDEIVQTKRIGIKKSVELPWRFYIKNSSYISKK